MAKTIDKILLGALVILLIGMSGAFITALDYNEADHGEITKKQLVVRDISAAHELEDDDEKDVPITGSSLDKASAAALAYIGQGRVTDSEIGDEEGYYEIEITLDDGSEVDVHLDEHFTVISTEHEDEEDDD